MRTVFNSILLTCQGEETDRRATSLVVTSTALTIILLAATMVTITFLMSPVIEEMFGTDTSNTTQS